MREQTPKELQQMAEEFGGCGGRILAVYENKKKDGDPFWVFTLRARLGVDSPSVEKNFISWNKIPEAEPGRIIYFNLAEKEFNGHPVIIEAKIDWTTKQKTEVRVKNPLPLTKLEFAIKQGALPMENSIQKLTFDKAFGLVLDSGKLDHRFWQILLVCAAKIVQGRVQPAFDDIEQFIDVYQYLWEQNDENRHQLCPSIYITDTDIKTLLHHQNEWSSDDCLRLVQILPRIVFGRRQFQGMYVKTTGKNKGSWHEITVDDFHAFASYQLLESKHIKKGLGAGEPERAYQIHLDSKTALIFWHNLASGAYSLLTNDGVSEKFLKIRPSAQLITASIWLWHKSPVATLNANQWLAITGEKPAERSDHRRRQLDNLETIFEEIEKAGFISSWQPLKGESYKLNKRNYRAIESKRTNPSPAIPQN